MQLCREPRRDRPVSHRALQPRHSLSNTGFLALKGCECYGLAEPRSGETRSLLGEHNPIFFSWYSNALWSRRKSRSHQGSADGSQMPSCCAEKVLNNEFFYTHNAQVSRKSHLFFLLFPKLGPPMLAFFKSQTTFLESSSISQEV